MKKKYNFTKIEKKWQKIWKDKKTFQTKNVSKKPKFYILDMFPYPSGAGLHVGHPRGFTATDVYSRYKRMKGFNVLHPMGFDAFGLPAENYALKHKLHPADCTKKNIKRYKKQLEIIGMDYDWSRSLSTTDPDYYKWTQWAFLQMFKKGLAYESLEPINWCPKCQTGLANEDLEGDRCERCDSNIIKKPLRQWVLKITKYADRLLKDLKYLDWPEYIKELQKNWIGKSQGHTIEFQTNVDKISVFTTRIDTLFGATYIAIAPEHELVKQGKNKLELEKYVKKSLKKPDVERAKEKTGVVLQGVKAINPVTGKKIPIWVADYVLPDYGSGAIMAVPAHDQRDYEFAQKFNLPIKKVIKNNIKEKAFEEIGILVNSGKFSGMTSEKAKKEIAQLVKAKAKTTYRIKDWVFSRQRYWGEPIPLVHCAKCGVVPVPEKDLPVTLPKVKSYQATKTGESPLKNIDSWVKTKCPQCKGEAKRETNTMPQWAGSCWYYLRYIDNKNNKALVDPKKEKYWMPVDFYVGGVEHATRHLIYARFWHKFLYDIGIVSTLEPFLKLKNPGMVLATDHRKMSKRWGNVINPDDVIKEYGADAFRMYEMFMGAFEQETAWSNKGIKGIKRFLDRVWKLKKQPGKSIESIREKTIKKVTQDLEEFKFNTAISSLMILLNEMEKSKVTKKDIKTFLILLYPLAPHISSELWQRNEFPSNVFSQKWPNFKEIKEQKVKIVIQVNGKVRGFLESDSGIDQNQAKEKSLPKIEKWVKKNQIKKIIFVPDKLINFVI